METFLEILKYILPSLIMFGGVYLVMNKFLDTEHRKQLLLLRQENQKVTTPLRLQAYERLVLYLERMAMDKLVIRLNKPGMTAKSLQANLLRTIQEEFDHNLTQQLYISNTSWDTIKATKAELFKAINMAGAQMKPTSNAAELGQKIFEIMLKLDKSPSQIAILILKKEIRQLF